MVGYVYNRACIKVRLKISRTENDQFIGNAKINTVVLDNLQNAYSVTFILCLTNLHVTGINSNMQIDKQGDVFLFCVLNL